MFPGLLPNSGTGKRAPKMFHGNALVNCFRYELPEGVSRKCFRGVVFGRFFGTAPFFSLFLMNAGCLFFGKRKWKKRPIVDESVRNMPQEAKSVLAFTLFYTYRMGPEGDPFRSCKTNVDF